MDVVTYALLSKRLKGVATGIKNIELGSDNKSLVFTTNNDTKITVNMPTADLVYVGDTQPPVGSNYELWIDTSESGGSGGSSILSKELTATVNIGSVTKGKVYPAGTSLESIIRDILISETSPSGTLSYIPSYNLYDVIKDTVSDLTIKINAVKGTYDIAKIEFYVNDVIVNTLDTAATIKDGGTFSYNQHFDTPTKENIKLKVVITDTKGLKANPNTVIKFVGATYYGLVPESTVIDEGVVKALNSTLKDTLSFNYTDITTEGTDLYHITLCYPKSFGTITSIKDGLDWEYIQDYTIEDITIDGMEYKLYYLTNAVSVTDFSQKYR